MNSSAPPVEGQQWFNTEFSSWEELSGRTIVLVFWALADEASLARLQQVQSLSERYDDVTAIGIHTPRVRFEDDTDNLESLMAQQNITLPVVHDPAYIAWNRYNPEGWPTTVVIGDRSTVIGAQAGVDYFETVEEAVWLSVNIGKQRRAGAAISRGLPQSSSKPPIPMGQLAFPTSIRSFGNGKVAIVDSGHNRVLIADWQPDRATLLVTSIIDGFQQPQAVTVAPGGSQCNTIYVTERATGSVIRCDLTSGEKFVLSEGLLRPMGLTIDIDGSLVVADAAAEQLLRIANPEASGHIQLGAIAGTGRSGAEDGASNFATLRQPVALQRTEVGLIFCEAAGSSLRLLTDAGKVKTIIGEDSAWGHVDGPVHQVQLQCPSDITMLNDGSIVIVDTGNHKLRRLSSRRVKTVGPQTLNRPTSACAMPSGHLLVADTGNGRILALDPNLKDSTQLAIEGLTTRPPSVQARRLSSPSETPTLKRQGTSGDELLLDFPAPSSGPWMISVHGEPSTILEAPVSTIRNKSADVVSVTLGAPGDGQLIIRSELERDSTVHQTTQVHLQVRAFNANVTISGG